MVVSLEGGDDDSYSGGGFRRAEIYLASPVTFASEVQDVAAASAVTRVEYCMNLFRRLVANKTSSSTWAYGVVVLRGGMIQEVKVRDRCCYIYIERKRKVCSCNELGLDIVVPNYVSLLISPFIPTRSSLYDFEVIMQYYYIATPRVSIIFLFHYYHCLPFDSFRCTTIQLRWV